MISLLQNDAPSFAALPALNTVETLNDGLQICRNVLIGTNEGTAIRDVVIDKVSTIRHIMILNNQSLLNIDSFTVSRCDALHTIEITSHCFLTLCERITISNCKELYQIRFGNDSLQRCKRLKLISISQQRITNRPSRT